MLEHDAVVTTGRRVVLGLEGLDIPVVHTERGGLATYHGPGQLVGYLIADMGRRGHTVKSTVAALESGIIQWLASRGVVGRLRTDARGVWVEGNKIAAIGLHFRRGVTMHGFALNLCTDLHGFGGFIPCGIHDGGVTSLERCSGQVVSCEAVAHDVGSTVLAHLRLTST
jgi:lipoyl(octanoyl) transferase